jgi:hypothetical protein
MYKDIKWVIRSPISYKDRKCNDKRKRTNQNSYIKEEQTTQCSKGKVQKDKQRSTTNTYKTKDRVARTLLKSGGTQVLWKGMQFLFH